MEEINNKICRYIVLRFTDVKLDCDDERNKKICYSIHVIIDAIEKALLLISVFGIIGCMKEILICMLAVWLTRRQMGGIHMSTWMGCTVMTLFFYLTVLLGGMYIRTSIYFTFGVYVVSVVFMIIFAPIPSKQRPRYCGERRVRIKIRGVIGIWVTLVMYICMNSLGNYIVWVLLLENIEVMVSIEEMVRNKTSKKIVD